MEFFSFNSFNRPFLYNIYNLIMEKTKKSLDWFKTRKITAFFAIIALIGGFLFLNPIMTGNVVLNNSHSFNMISTTGWLLILCSIILGIYSIRKR